jgi:HSP20 family protein
MIKFYSDFKELSSLFDELLSDSSFKQINGKFSPETDVIENDNNYIIELLLPGFIKENIKLTIEKDNLIISGERKKDNNIKFNKNQSYYGEFKKSFILPNDTNKGNINAKMENGILVVTINKKEEMKPISIIIE